MYASASASATWGWGRSLPTAHPPAPLFEEWGALVPNPSPRPPPSSREDMEEDPDPATAWSDSRMELMDSRVPIQNALDTLPANTNLILNWERLPCGYTSLDRLPLLADRIETFPPGVKGLDSANFAGAIQRHLSVRGLFPMPFDEYVGILSECFRFVYNSFEGAVGFSVGAESQIIQPADRDLLIGAPPSTTGDERDNSAFLLAPRLWDEFPLVIVGLDSVRVDKKSSFKSNPVDDIVAQCFPSGFSADGYRDASTHDRGVTLLMPDGSVFAGRHLGFQIVNERREEHRRWFYSIVDDVLSTRG
jgi:hypothetical protein